MLEWNLQGYDGQLLPPSRIGVLSPEAPEDLIDQLVGAMSDYYEAQRPPNFRETEDET